MLEIRPKTKKLKNATPNINLPFISNNYSSSTLNINWKDLSDKKDFVIRKFEEDFAKTKSSSLKCLNRNIKLKENKFLDFDIKGNYLNEHKSEENDLKVIKNDKKKNSKEENNLIEFKNKELINDVNQLGKTEEIDLNLNNSQLMQVKIKCFLCNNEFNIEQIINHETNCLNNWKNLSSFEKKLAIESQKKWLESNFNSIVPWQWKNFKLILKTCYKCNRNFFEHRLEKHQTYCKSKKIDKNEDNENIVLVRKTKPLVKTNNFYSNKNLISSPLSITNEINKELSLEKKDKFSLENKELNSKNLESSVSSKNLKYFVKCLQCERVLNKAKLKIHEKFHARNNHNQLNLSVDKIKNEIVFDNLNMNKINLDENKIEETEKKISSSKHLTCGESFYNKSADDPIITNKTIIENDFPKYNFDKLLNEKNPISNTIWLNHLSQLMKCKKCNRTFFSDRVEIHERNCKASPIQTN